MKPDRVWKIAEAELYLLLERVEQGDLTAEDAIAVMEEHATTFNEEDDRHGRRRAPGE